MPLHIVPKEAVVMKEIRKTLLVQLRTHRRKVRLRLKTNADRIVIRKDITAFETLIPIIQVFAERGNEVLTLPKREELTNVELFQRLELALDVVKETRVD